MTTQTAAAAAAAAAAISFSKGPEGGEQPLDPARLGGDLPAPAEQGVRRGSDAGDEGGRGGAAHVKGEGGGALGTGGKQPRRDSTRLGQSVRHQGVRGHDP